jgi:hypothetical protein
MVNRELTFRFSNWAGEPRAEIQFFSKLLELVTNRTSSYVSDLGTKVDVEFVSVYGATQLPSIFIRGRRFMQSHTESGIDFSNRKLSPNQQPHGNARFHIFFTGENERPPQGTWDAYLSFDQYSYGGRNAYLPLWWITSSDILVPTVSPYLQREITINQMLRSRSVDYLTRDKFCVAFIGKAYPFRMHTIEALSVLGKVDVYGGITRNRIAESKFEISKRYRFIFAFENDLFPGYITEKAPEAWATGAIPLYWGDDSSGILNQNAMLNLKNFSGMESYISEVSRVNAKQELWETIASQPLLNFRPDISQVISLLKSRLSPLIEE